MADRAWAAIAESGGRRTATNSSVACHGSIKVRISKELEFEAKQSRWISPATVVESLQSSSPPPPARRAFKAAAFACVSASMAESCSETTMASAAAAGEETSGVAGGSSSRISRASTAITG